MKRCICGCQRFALHGHQFAGKGCGQRFAALSRKQGLPKDPLSWWATTPRAEFYAEAVKRAPIASTVGKIPVSGHIQTQWDQ